MTFKTSIIETLSFYEFPEKPWRMIMTNKPVERILKEVKIKTKEISTFLDGQSTLMLVGTKIWHGTATKCRSPKYMKMRHVMEINMEKIFILTQSQPEVKSEKYLTLSNYSEPVGIKCLFSKSPCSALNTFSLCFFTVEI